MLQAWGVEPGYWDVGGHWRDVPETTLRAVREAMGAGIPGTSGTVPPGPRLDAPLFTAAQTGPWPYLPGGTLTLENGGTIELPADGPRPAELPLGYHCFEPAEPPAGGSPHDWPRIVAVCPARCPEPPPGRTWGWSAQLYATRSSDSWGIGDFADLRSLVDWAGDNGAGFVLLNPLNAPALGPVPEPSPYFPSSRCFLNPLYIRVEEVPGAGDLAGTATLAAKAKALNAARLIDRPRAERVLEPERASRLLAEFQLHARKVGLRWQQVQTGQGRPGDRLADRHSFAPQRARELNYENGIRNYDSCHHDDAHQRHHVEGSVRRQQK